MRIVNGRRVVVVTECGGRDLEMDAIVARQPTGDGDDSSGPADLGSAAALRLLEAGGNRDGDPDAADVEALAAALEDSMWEEAA